MSIQRKKLNIGKARRRVQMRSALVLTLGVCFAVCLLRSLRQAGEATWMGLIETLTTLVCFGGGAYLGLCVMDGDHRKMVPMRNLSRAQILWLSILGVLAIAPVSLISDLMTALTQGVYIAQGTAQRSTGFVQAFVKSVLLVPICEELFFRGYLLHALAPQGKLRACIVTALCFALVHTLEGFVPLAFLGMLLCWMALRMQSLLAPVLVHMSYNLALLVLDCMGMSGLLMGWSFVSCAVRLALCAAFVSVLRRAYTARTQTGSFVVWEGGKLTRREMALLISAVLLFIATIITRRLFGL